MSHSHDPVSSFRLASADMPGVRVAATAARLRERNNLKLVYENAMASTAVIREEIGARFPVVMGAVQCPSSTLARYYPTEGGAPPIPEPVQVAAVGAPGGRSAMPPSTFTSLTELMKKTREQKGIGFFRLRVIECHDESRRVFQLTGSHIVCGIIDARGGDSVDVWYYCPMGKECLIDFRQFADERRGDRVRVRSNTRSDQLPEDDGYCALYCHNMLLKLAEVASTGSTLEEFPPNDREHMFYEVASSFVDWSARDPLASSLLSLGA